MTASGLAAETSVRQLLREATALRLRLAREIAELRHTIETAKRLRLAIRDDVSRQVGRSR